jgi:outer membrane protein assembly factor BamB
MKKPPARSRLWIVVALALNLIALAAIAYSLGLFKLTGLFSGKAEPVAGAGSEQAPSGTMSMNLDEPPPIVPLSETSPLDWTSLSGTWGNCTSPETGLIDSFQPAGGPGSNVLWKRADLASNSTPIVMWDKLYIVVRDQVDGRTVGERIVCVNANTGDNDWQNRFGPGLADTPNESVGAAALAGDIAISWVYVLSSGETLRCVDGVTGQIVWTVSLRETFGMETTPTSLNRQPLVCDNLVIVGGFTTGWGPNAKPTYRYMAFDRMKGALAWISACPSEVDTIREAAAAITMHNGSKVLTGTDSSGHMWNVQPRTGLPIGTTLFYASGTAELLTPLIALTQEGTDVLPSPAFAWITSTNTMPLSVDERGYLLDETGTLTVLDLKTKQPVGTPQSLGAPASGNMLYADGKIYVVTKTGHWIIWRPDATQGVVKVSEGDFPAGETCATSPICSHGKIFIATSGGLYCLKDEKKTATEPVAKYPLEKPTEGDRSAKHLLLVPAEVTLAAGAKQAFTMQAFDSAGQSVTAGKGTYSVEGPGAIDAEGNLVVPEDAPASIATVTVKMGDLVGQSRVRIMRQLPWEFTWDDKPEIPATWVGVSPRLSVRDAGGGSALVCAASGEGDTVTRCWIGPSNLRNYTLQADVRATAVDGKLPSPGLIAQGYSLVLNGETAKLELRRWTPQPEQNPSAEFPWQADTWYVLKLRTQASPNGQVSVQGKVWPRDAEEPSEWTVTLTDPAPNLNGSPGLDCPASAAEVAFDNLRVTSNSPGRRTGKKRAQ